jgi:3-oxoacyl-[acyl-carrier-protein] synthase II
MVVAEGGGIVILEDYERAKARGARIYAEIVGFGQTSDAVDIHNFATDGVQYARAMTQALERGGLTPNDVDYVNADGRATVVADRSEAKAIGLAFGDRAATVPVSAPRSMMGNPLAGAGPIDLAFIAMAMRDSVLPPTINLTEQDPNCHLNLVTAIGQAANVDVALLCSRGATGVNAALALRKVR